MFEFNSGEMKFCEYFVSLEGEGYTIGESVLFMRMSGGCGKDGICACKFCDTKYSWTVKPEHWSLKDASFVNELLKEVDGRDIKRITLTGGEPLKYGDKIFEFAKEMKAILPSIKFLGIESNGAMLTTEENTLEILKQFNWINKINIDPMLTMSPKINYKASWYQHTDMNQEEVNKIYFKAFENAENIIAPFKVFYKFIYDFTDNIIPWEHTNMFIQKLFDLGVSNERIMLMALTPEDPEGRDKQFWEDSQRETAKKALEIGIRYSPRLHVNLGLE